MNQRKEFVLKAIHTNNFRKLCEEYGVSTKTGYKWRERFYENGFEGMKEHSRRPLRHAKELGEAVICEIVRLRSAHPKWGARKLRDIYQRLHGEVVAGEGCDQHDQRGARQMEICDQAIYSAKLVRRTNEDPRVR